jgi:hypothetical protein
MGHKFLTFLTPNFLSPSPCLSVHQRRILPSGKNKSRNSIKKVEINSLNNRSRSIVVHPGFKRLLYIHIELISPVFNIYCYKKVNIIYKKFTKYILNNNFGIYHHRLVILYRQMDKLSNLNKLIFRIR